MTNNKYRLLIVEDETAIRTGLIDVFVYHGYEVDTADNGLDGLNKSMSGKFDLILLDVMLPGINGYEICERIREEDRNQPIIMLTAKGADDEVIQGLALGADDYVTKPFSIAQLVLRVEAVLRRAKPQKIQQQMIKLGADTTVDTVNLSGQHKNQDLSFTRREMDILQYLHQYHDRPVSRDELLNGVWGYAKNLDLETRTVDIHIAKLRRKIEPNPGKPQYLITVRGAGYKLLSADSKLQSE